jgi:hypothetical protein
MQISLKNLIPKSCNSNLQNIKLQWLKMLRFEQKGSRCKHLLPFCSFLFLATYFLCIHSTNQVNEALHPSHTLLKTVAPVTVQKRIHTYSQYGRQQLYIHHDICCFLFVENNHNFHLQYFHLMGNSGRLSPFTFRKESLFSMK